VGRAGEGGGDEAAPGAALRRARRTDESALWPVLDCAARMAEQPRLTPGAAHADAERGRDVAGWGRPGDLGVMAQDGEGRLLGAAWLRRMAGEDRRRAVCADAGTPEVAVAVLPGRRGGGFGARLLPALVAAAAENGYPALVLSVRDGQPARRLHERPGVRAVGRIANRVAGVSAKIVLDLAPEGHRPTGRGVHVGRASTGDAPRAGERTSDVLAAGASPQRGPGRHRPDSLAPDPMQAWRTFA
jgi:GNAT superfamily N-acetyltransferase